MVGVATNPLAALTTQIVGSYAKPNWLLRKALSFRFDSEPWRPDPEVLDEAREDAARLAIYDQERAGLDVITDGEAQRAAYDRYFYARLGGVDAADLAVRAPKEQFADALRRVREDRAEDLVWGRSHLPRIVGPVTWPGPLSLRELQFLKRHATKPVKATVVGPVTSYGKMADEHYGDPEQGIMALAAVINQELRSLDAEGAALLQIDEPILHTSAPVGLRFGTAALTAATEGIRAPVIVHVCYGYAYYSVEKQRSAAYADVLEMLASHDRIAGISLEYEQPGHGPELLQACGDKHVLLGLLNLASEAVETVEHIGRRIDEALTVLKPERLHPSSDCGMWHLPRDVAFGKISALVNGTNVIRRRLGLTTRQSFDRR